MAGWLVGNGGCGGSRQEADEIEMMMNVVMTAKLTIRWNLSTQCSSLGESCPNGREKKVLTHHSFINALIRFHSFKLAPTLSFQLAHSIDFISQPHLFSFSTLNTSTFLPQTSPQTFSTLFHRLHSPNTLSPDLTLSQPHTFQTRIHLTHSFKHASRQSSSD